MYVILKSQVYVWFPVFGLLWCGIRAECGWLQWLHVGSVVVFNFVFVRQLGTTSSSACDNYSFSSVANVVWCLLVKVSDTFARLSAFLCCVPFTFYYSFAVDHLIFAGVLRKMVAVVSKWRNCGFFRCCVSFIISFYSSISWNPDDCSFCVGLILGWRLSIGYVRMISLRILQRSQSRCIRRPGLRDL